MAALVLITPPASYLVDGPSDAATVAAARMAEPRFAAAVAAMKAGPDPSSDDTFTAWQQAIAPLGYAKWTRPNRHTLTMAAIHWPPLEPT